VTGILFFLSCRKEKSWEGCREGNKPPFANAGADQKITLPKDSANLGWASACISVGNKIYAAGAVGDDYLKGCKLEFKSA
jgi:hypothetical protein